jgi:hypothetical protein
VRKIIELNKGETLVVTHKSSAWDFIISLDVGDDLQYRKRPSTSWHNHFIAKKRLKAYNLTKKEKEEILTRLRGK